jgi:ABC-type Mn2+/Zn2+ transport system permease subunit
MSLRIFHLVFVAVSVILAAFVAAWAGQQYRTASDVTYAVTALAALATGVGLAFYGAAFQRKTRKLKL